MNQARQIWCMLLKIACWCVVTFGAVTVAVYAYDHISPDAANSQFFGRKDKHPTQLFNTFTNYGYAATSAVALAQVRWSKPWLYAPFLLVGLWGLIVAISSALFHGTTGYGATGDWDVSSILPFILSIAWLELSALYLIFDYNCRGHNRGWQPQDCFLCRPLNVAMLLVEVAVFVIHFEDWIPNLDWDDRFEIFIASIATLLALGSVLFFGASCYKCIDDRRTGMELRWKFHISIFLASLVPIAVFVGVGLHDKALEHGFIRHLAASGMISIIVLFCRVIWVSTDNS